jgi:4'-phosphopantetheinyl transferase
MSVNTVVDVWCMTVAHDREVIGRARTILTSEEIERARSYSLRSLEDDFVLSRASLRLILSRLVGRAPADVRFAYGPHGKPALADPASSVSFNVSHSRGLLACAVVRGPQVGVDVEHRRSIPDYEEVARRFFSPAEYDELLGVPEPQRMVAFYDVWVRKEAFVKALGGGLSIPLDTFRVSLASGLGAMLLEVRGMPTEAAAWTIAPFSPAPDFSAAIAVRHARSHVRVRKIAARDLLAGIPDANH